MSITRRFVWQLKPGDDLFAIPVPFDPKPVFGRTNAPVVVTIGAQTYRSTITNMGGSPWIPFRKSNRAAAAIPESGPVEVTLTLDEAKRVVELPDDLAAALGAIDGAQAAWDAMSFTAQREHVEGLIEARRPETRAKRLDKAIEAVTARLK
ncbi:YdeI/OmpD-associated family protein [Sphingobium nicotianae]|uniref:YdeI/OmpD-associated family protein n=1 Tax=Sphingobium nicotianae TaxID=2782607 RepID=A0A9X1DG22_9SPHN|nr:YdeI/OmpD-associated family protein [Sphingobium nicotianae]MBT2189371.1 YdeI/OmpD-associated family protein [Sphingobium nicotianae]